MLTTKQDDLEKISLVSKQKKVPWSRKFWVKKIVPIEETAPYLKKKKIIESNAYNPYPPLLTADQGKPTYTSTFSTFKPNEKILQLTIYFKIAEDYWLSIIINSIFIQI